MIRVLRSWEDLPADLLGGAVSVGNFDGVHLGHAALARELVSQARQVGGAALVMTFDPPPRALLDPHRPVTPPLTTIERRAELLEVLGVDAMLAYPTDRRLLALSAEAFFDQIIRGKLRAKAIVEGPNFRFGKDRAGDTELLRKFCRAHGIGCSIVPPTVDDEGMMISSTRVRRLIQAGEVARANRLLTSPYELQGIVAAGAGRGQRLGFPTANLEGIRCLLPAHGVYAGAVRLDEGILPAAIHVGPNPTFGEQAAKVEVHILDWNGTLYGSDLRVRFVDRVRDVQRFASIDALRAQLQDDIAAVRRIVATESQSN